MTSERVDAEGISNIAKAAKHFLPAQRFQPEVEQVLSMRSAADLEVWEKLDDTIMGGKSGSYLQTAEDLRGFQGDYKDKQPFDFEGSVWRGETITDGGGFCGARTKVMACFSFSSSGQRFEDLAHVYCIFFFAGHHHAGCAQVHECCRSVAILTLWSHAVTLHFVCLLLKAYQQRTGCCWPSFAENNSPQALLLANALTGHAFLCRCWI